jgi:hypothetical protein
MSIQTIRTDKSLSGNCCFCEELLEHTLTGEKVVVLNCGHNSHLECLSALMITTVPLIPENFNKVMPRCPTCGEPGIPTDTSLHLDLLKKKMESLPNSPINIYFNDISASPSYVKKVPESTLIWTLETPRKNSTLSTISGFSALSYSSIGSERSHISHSSVSSMDSLDCKLNLDTNFHSIKEVTKAIPNTLLESRIKQIAAPIVEIIPEVDSVFIKSQYISGSKTQKDIYVTSAVSVQIPSDRQQLSPTVRNSMIKLQDREILSRVRKYIYDSVAEWKNLDFSKFGSIRLCDTFLVSQDKLMWQKLDCYLFDTILVLIKRYSDSDSRQIKGSVAIKDHLVSISLPRTGNRNEHLISLNLSTKSLPRLYLKTTDSIVLENWYSALIDWDCVFPSHRLVPSDDHEGQRLTGNDGTVTLRRLPTSSHMPTDTVILVPLSGSPDGTKFPAIRSTILSIFSEMNLFDRVSLVPFGIGAHHYVYGLADSAWKPWTKIVNSLKPTGGGGSRQDLMVGLNTALNLLEGRETSNPVSSIIVISDSLIDFNDEELILVNSRANLKNINIHTFGVSTRHSAQKLESISARCNGNYFYVRSWNDLHPTVVGQFRSLQNYTHCNLSISLSTTTPDVNIVGIAGHNPKVGINCGAFSPPLTPTKYTTENLTTNLYYVDLGDMTASEQRTFLVQVRIRSNLLQMTRSGKFVDVPFELFNVTAAFSSFAGPAEECLHRDEFFIPVGSAHIAIEDLNPFINELIESPKLSSPVSLDDLTFIGGGEELVTAISSTSSMYDRTTITSLPSSLSTFNGHPGALGYAEKDEGIELMPSIVYGGMTRRAASGMVVNTFQSLEKSNIWVVQRRIQLTAINVLEYVVRANLHGSDLGKAVQTINTGRNIVEQLRASVDYKLLDDSGLNFKKITNSRSQGDREKLSAISIEVDQLVEILNNLFNVMLEGLKKVTAFEEDTKKMLIQFIGVLRNEKGYTRRTPLEDLFFQRQKENNVL